MATDEICLHKTLEGIKKLVSDAGGKILAEDFRIISQLQESFREVVKAHSSEGSDFIKNVLRHLITKNDYGEKCNLRKRGQKNDEVRSSPKSAEVI